MIHPHDYRLQWKRSKKVPCLVVSNICLYRYFYTHPDTTMRNITHATLKPFCTLYTLFICMMCACVRVCVCACVTESMSNTIGKISVLH